MFPLYLVKLTPNDLKERSKALYELFVECRICPNECKARRSEGATGKCHSTDEVIISSAGVRTLVKNRRSSVHSDREQFFLQIAIYPASFARTMI